MGDALDASTFRQGKKGMQLSDKERQEFDNITSDQIQAIKDVGKLRRMVEFFTQEGFEPTADAVRRRMKELGASDPVKDPQLRQQAQAELQDARQSLKTWTGKAKSSEDALTKAKMTSLRDEEERVKGAAYPPVRRPLVIAVGGAGGDQGGKKPKQGGKDTKESDKTQGKDQKQKKSHEVPPAPGGVQGPALTKHLIEANQQLTDKEREWNAEQEKAKGNDHFRAKEYTEAIERYTISLGYCPGNAALHANRAAAYIKLKMWDAAELDCDNALVMYPQHTKAMIRRAAARLELGKVGPALQDLQAALSLDPENPQIIAMHERTLKALGRPTSSKAGSRRLAIEEVEEGDAQETPAVSTGDKQPEEPKRTRISIVEDSESDEGEAAGKQHLPQQQANSIMVATDAKKGDKDQEAAPTQTSHDPAADGNTSVPFSAQPAAHAARKGVKVPVTERASSEDETGQRPQRPQQQGVAVAGRKEDAPKQRGVADKTEGQAAKPGADQVEVDATAAPATQSPGAQASQPAAQAQPKAPAPAPAPAAAVEQLPGPILLPTFDEEVTRLKDQGNASFMAGRLVHAIQLYSEAIKLSPDNAVLYSNRSLARLKGQDAQGCLLDALIARALDPTNHKALHRCASAKRQLGMQESAMADLKKAITLATLPKERSKLQEDLKQVTADLEVQKKAALKAKQEKEAKRATAKKSFKYKGGLTIEEHSDEEDGADGARVLSDKLRQHEMSAAHMVDRARQLATSAREGFEANQRKMVVEQDNHQAMVAKQQQQKQAVQLQQLAKEQADQQNQQQQARQQEAKQQLAKEQANRQQAKQEQQEAQQQLVNEQPHQQQQQQQQQEQEQQKAQVKPAPAPRAAWPFANMDLEAMKAHGTSLFQMRDLAGAQAAWGHVLEHAQPGSAMAIAVHMNMALLCVQTGDAGTALTHANVALKAMQPGDKSYHKALHRRALALTKLGKLEDAMADYGQLTRMMGYSVQVENEMNDLAERIRQLPASPQTEATQQQQAQQQPSTPAQPSPPLPTATSPGSTLKPAGAAPAQPAAQAATSKPAAQPTRTKIPIEMADSDESDSEGASVSPSQKPLAPPPSERQSKQPPQQPPQQQQPQQRCTPPPPTPSIQQAAADQQREEGNAHFKAGRLHEALKCYDGSLRLSPSAPAHCNRALVLLRLNDAASAEAACRTALSLDPTYLKATHRLGDALRRQGKLPEALSCMREVVAGYPTDAKFRAEVAALEAQLGLNSTAQQPSKPQPQPQQEQPQQQQQRRKIQVEEADSDEDEGTPSNSKASTAAGASAPSQASTRASAAHAAHRKAPSQQDAPSQCHGQEGDSNRSTKGAASSKVHEAAAAKAAAAIASLSTRRPAAPKNGVDFQNACKLVSSNPQALADYVASLDPSQYQAIFKTQMDNACLSHILHGLQLIVKDDPSFSANALQQLISVSRFSMLAAMLPKADKAIVREVLEALEAAGTDKALVQDMRAKYKA